MLRKEEEREAYPAHKADRHMSCAGDEQIRLLFFRFFRFYFQLAQVNKLRRIYPMLTC